ncbi:MAG: hypothetical protein ACFCVD_05505 [Nodosilinea sp.]
MGKVAGVDSYTTDGYAGVAIVGTTITISFKDFSTSAEATALEAVLTINGNLAKRHIELGPLPPASTTFDLPVPAGTDISLFNTVVIRTAGSDIVVGKAALP